MPRKPHRLDFGLLQHAIPRARAGRGGGSGRCRQCIQTWVSRWRDGPELCIHNQTRAPVSPRPQRPRHSALRAMEPTPSPPAGRHAAALAVPSATPSAVPQPSVLLGESAWLLGARFASLRELLEAWPTDGVGLEEALGLDAVKAVPLADLRLCAPVDAAAAVLGIGKNYSDHVKASASPAGFSRSGSRAAGPGSTPSALAASAFRSLSRRRLRPRSRTSPPAPRLRRPSSSRRRQAARSHTATPSACRRTPPRSTMRGRSAW